MSADDFLDSGPPRNPQDDIAENTSASVRALRDVEVALITASEAAQEHNRRLEEMHLAQLRSSERIETALGHVRWLLAAVLLVLLLRAFS